MRINKKKNTNIKRKDAETRGNIIFEN